MRIRTLGAAACIGYPGHTTSFLIDENTLLDCGTGVGTLSLEQLLNIHHVLLSHSHLDHCSYLPLLADVHARHNGSGLTVYSEPETLQILHRHLFNDELWPNYCQQPSVEHPWVRMQAVEVGDTFPINDGLATVLPASHSLPAIGWLLEGNWRAMAFSGTTGTCPAFWHWMNSVPSLTDIVCEVTYSNQLSHHARVQDRMTPAQLQPFLANLPPNLHLWISHLNPLCSQAVMTQLAEGLPANVDLWPLTADTVIEL
ncbi:3',5'-cyclic-nucleotide phosphodiesterase [Neisseriaceae bacterium TC5R-5]|nr:3',5'-cyclic-nucleotide phosphodiesterase [Neisseriaceae bacterium TC5R-5]